MKTFISPDDIEKFVVVRSFSRTVATTRLSSEPILLGLSQIGPGKAAVFVPQPDKTLSVGCATCLLFHYDDRAAVEAIRSRVKGPFPELIICLCSDVYSYREYIAVHDMVDFYIAPTEHHRKLLASQLYRPVYAIGECIDPIAFGDSDLAASQSANRGDFNVKENKRTTWFGYAESFSKGMSSLLPVIEDNIRENHIDCFSIIVDEDNFSRKFGDKFKVSTLPYDNKTFRGSASGFDYAILSHFALDLELNSYIKSPNKAITALFAGLIPLCSDTPNYGELLESFGLGRFLFTSATEFDRLLKRLDPIADSRAIQRSGIIASLAQARSHAQLTQDFLNIIARYCARTDDRKYESMQPSPIVPEAPLSLTFKEHIRDLVPSAVRAMKRRV